MWCACQGGGINPIGPEWPSSYYHPKWLLMLSSYVDDFNMAGLKANISYGWQIFCVRAYTLSLSNGPMQLERSTWVAATSLRRFGYLRALLLPRWFTIWRIFLKSCIARYREVVGSKVPLSQLFHTFPGRGPQGRPCGCSWNWPGQRVPWCYHTGTPASFVQYLLWTSFPYSGK